MHYPPETASVMIIAQMIATVLQVSPITLLLIHNLINDNDRWVHLNKTHDLGEHRESMLVPATIFNYLCIGYYISVG